MAKNDPKPDPKVCQPCGGTGKRLVPGGSGFAAVTCWDCNGTGRA